LARAGIETWLYGAATRNCSANTARFHDAKKESPGAGSAEAHTHYTERTISPDRTQLGVGSMPSAYGSSVTIRCQFF
jgi:hypothetical protein